MTIRYPFGYGTGRLSMPQLRARYEPNMHPAMARRLFPWLESMGGRVGAARSMGCGGGRRLVQPEKPGFAPPGKSFHEDQRFASGLVAYSAVDLVVGTSGVHRSPTWAEVAGADRFGLHCFISGEPWHVQCIEMRGHTSWVNAGRPDPAMDYPLPDTPWNPIPNPVTDYDPPEDWWLFPLDQNKPTLRIGARDSGIVGHVRYLQDFLFLYAGGDIHRDGEFGPQTERRVIDFQRFLNLAADGVVGAQTWGMVDWVVAERTRPTSPPPVSGPVVPVGPEGSVSPCRYYVRRDDSPWRVGERVYGSGQAGADTLPADAFLEWSTRARPVFVDIPGIAGVTSTVLHGDGGYAILARMGFPRTAISTFYLWNGGADRVLFEGDTIHMPVTG